MNKEKLNFIIRYGVLAWGVPLAIIWAFFFSLKTSLSLEEFQTKLLYAIIVFPLGGFFVGLILSFKVSSKEDLPAIRKRDYFIFLLGIIFAIFLVLVSSL